MPRVLIAGCGYVGSATADLFHAASWEVEGWSRSGGLANKPYLVRAVDIAARNQVQSAAGEFDLVIHCASSGGGGAESYRQVYLEGARNLIEVLQPGLFIFTSSTSVYAQANGEWVDEASVAEPAHESGRILRATEELVSQSRGMIARVAGIYGPGRSALLRKFLSGEARIAGDGSRFINQVHRDDIAAALILLAQLPNEQRSSGLVVNIVDNQPITERASYEWLAAKLGHPIPEITESPPARKRGASNKRVSNQKLRSLGWTPTFPTFQIGMEKSVLPSTAQSA